MALDITKAAHVRRVMLIAPGPPPCGGMALQALLLAKRLREDGITVSSFASNFALPKLFHCFDRVPIARTLIRALAIWAKLEKQARHVDVIHVFGASWLYFLLVVTPSVVIGKLLRKRVVLNYRGGHAGRFFRYWGWAAAPVLRMADIITVPSPFLAEIISKQFRLPSTVVRNLLDESVFRWKRRTTIQPRIVVARHLEEMYGIESVLRAFRIIQQRYPEASLAVAGVGRLRERLGALAREWNLRSVDFLGHVAHENMQQIYDRCDIFLNGSLVDNFPGALLEASAAGLVVVSTGAGGIPSMYENGKDALLVPPGDWQALAAAAEQVLASPALAQRLINGGVALARSCYWTTVRGSIYRTYGFSQDAALLPETAMVAN